MALVTTLRSVRSTLANRRTERIAHRRLSAELAAFQTPAERAELDEMLSRYSPEDTEQIRAILNLQDFERQRSVVGGFRA